jgi:hypothetical protein
MPKISDIIEVPPVKTVIELATVRDYDAENAEEPTNLLETFVVTEDIEKNLQIILERVASYPNEGMGFFLTGNFGSGKSHFLSVLSLLLQFQWAWKYITSQSQKLSQYESKLGERKLLVIQIPLLEYRKTDTLEDIFWNSVEETLASNRYKIFKPLAQSSYFLEQFDKYIMPAHGRELNTFIQGRLSSKYTWDVLRRESADDAIMFAQEFLKVQGTDIPFKLTLDRQKAWDKLIALIKEHKLSGIVVLMDELSEFLKSKPDARALNEDTRFLQFLGEKSIHSPFWIMGALQEAIEKTGDINQATFNKIKDRYQRNLELSAQHIRELIDRRLIRKKGVEAINAIKEAYQSLRNSFNDLKISEDEFLQIYPVHPETLELLDVNTKFFSQRRGVVDFIHYQVKGDPSRQINGIMDEDYTQLLTPDKIFDHFSFRIREMVDLNPYFQIYRDYFEKRIPRIFEDPVDQECALKILKILILLKISPMFETRTVRQIANMVLYNYTDLGGDLNYEYIQQHILKKLHTEASYIKVKQGQDPLSDIYYIDLESKVSDIIDNKKRDILLNVAETDQRILDVAFDQLVYGPLPMAHLRGIYSERKNIPWENTPRSGTAKLQNLLEITNAEIDQVLEKLRTTEDDFVLYIGTPFSTTEQKEHLQRILNSYPDRFINGIIYWLPRDLDDPNKLQILKEFYAQHEILTEYSSDGSRTAMDIRDNLRKSMEEKILQVRDVIEELYFSGSIYTVSDEIHGLDLADSRLQNFNNTLAKMIREPLRVVYPSHIAPEIEISTRRLISDLIDDFVRPGRADDINAPHLRYLKASIEGIAIPLGLAKKRDNGYDLNVDISKIPILAKIVNQIPQDSASSQDKKTQIQGDSTLKIESGLVSYDWLYQQLRKSECGIIAPIYELLIIALMRKGQIVGYKSGIQVSVSHVGFPVSSYVQQLGRGQLIDNDLRWQLGAVLEAIFGEKLQDYDVEGQEEIWSRLCELRDKVSRSVMSSRQELQNLSDRLSPSAVDISGIMDGLVKTQGLLAEIRPSLSSREGIEHFLKMIPSKLSPDDDIRQLINKAESIRAFVNEEMQEILNIKGYITSPSLIIPDKEKYQELRSLKEKVESMLKVDEKFIFEDGIDKLKSAFKQFREVFINVYSVEHNKSNDSVDPDSFTQIKNSDNYQLLSQLAKISMVAVPNDLTKINKLIENESKRSCDRPVYEELEISPICRCGYRLGTDVRSVSASEVAKMIEIGIKQYVTSLQEPPYGDQIEDYMTKMRQLDQDIPQKELTGLLRLEPDLLIEDLKDELSRLLTPTAIQHINRALGGNIVIVKRKMSQLQQDLIDKKYPKARVREIVNQWLEGGEKLPEDVYIMIEEE